MDSYLLGWYLTPQNIAFGMAVTAKSGTYFLNKEFFFLKKSIDFFFNVIILLLEKLNKLSWAGFISKD